MSIRLKTRLLHAWWHIGQRLYHFWRAQELLRAGRSIALTASMYTLSYSKRSLVNRNNKSITLYCTKKLLQYSTKIEMSQSDIQPVFLSIRIVQSGDE